MKPGLIRLPEENSLLPDYPAGNITASVSFTVAEDGTVSEVLLGQTADFRYEYVMASAAWDQVFPLQPKKCRVTWNHLFE